MAYVLSACLTMVSGVLVFIITSLLKENRTLKDEQKKKEDATNEGILCLLRVNLIEYHDRYVPLGAIPSYAYDNWCKMYKAYRTLGGNGMIVGMNEEIEKLHIR